jgi:hypothetical protein
VSLPDPAAAIRDDHHDLEHFEPLLEFDDPVTLVTLTIAKSLKSWLVGKGVRP